LNWNQSPPQITGTVSGSNWTADLIAERATNTWPAGAYTMLIPPATQNTLPNASPGGDGYALITNNGTSSQITGVLSDGKAFSQSVQVSQDGYIPVYANLYAKKGLILGWINLGLTNTANVSLTWIHPKTVSGVYKTGFTNVLDASQILLSPWIIPPSNLELLTNLSFLEDVNTTNAWINMPVVINNKFELNDTDGISLSGSINPKSGLLKVSVGKGPSKLTGYGAILANSNYGGGYFLTETNAGAILLQP
jgi:hypothetical protein